MNIFATNSVDFSMQLDALISANGAKWVADQIRVSANPTATTYDVECAQFEGDWDVTGRKAVHALIEKLQEASFPVRHDQPTTPPVTKIVPRDMDRTGLFPEYDGIAPIVHEGMRITIPVRELLEKSGATILHSHTPDGPRYDVALGRKIPPGIVAVTICFSGQKGLRLEIEPEYPGEYYDKWLQADWTPCCKCGAPLIWYEAGYVPGYRVCANPPHHHQMV